MYMKYREILEIVKDFFKKHKDVNQVFVCNDADLNAIPNKKYPYIQIELVNIFNQEYSTEYSLQITAGDIITDNLMNSGVDDAKAIVVSECYDILQDFVDYLTYETTLININNNPIFTPFDDENNDRVYGITSNIDILAGRIRYCTDRIKED